MNKMKQCNVMMYNERKQNTICKYILFDFILTLFVDSSLILNRQNNLKITWNPCHSHPHL